MDSINFILENSLTADQSSHIEHTLDKFKGVSSVSVNAQSGSVSVDFDSSAISARKLTDCLKDIGFNPQ